MLPLPQLLLSLVALLVLQPMAIHAQRFSLRGESYPNHGLVTREEVGETDNTGMDPGNALHCIAFSGCCDDSVRKEERGEFVFPGGTTNVSTFNNIGETGYYRNRQRDRIFLNRRGGSTQGIFQCLIRTDSSQTTYDTFYIGVYGGDSGTPTITAVTYDNSDTATCTSSGGPATEVTWRRNCVIIQPNAEDFTQTVTDTSLATYENTLKLPSMDNDGVYTCSVSNVRGYSNSMTGVGADYTPLPVTVAISASSTPVAGQNFTLTCTATTTLSNPTYQWFDDSGMLIGNSSILTINELLESNTGEYSCQVTAGSGDNQRYGCGVERVVVQAPILNVTVNNATNAVAGTTHTLSCSVTGADLQGATVSYVWQLNGVVIAGATSSTYNITSVQVTDAGNVYTCQVTVMSNMIGSFGGSGSGTLMVAINNPTVQLSKLILGTLYVGLTFMWRCDAEIPGSQVAGFTAEIEWRGLGGNVLTNNSRIAVGSVEEETPGREYRSLLTFAPLSAMDTGSYSCSATVRPTVANSNVINGVGSVSDTLTVTAITVSVSVQQTSVPSQLLDLPSYNGFSLTCTATSRAATLDVTLTKEITWMRSVDGGNSEVLTDPSTNGDVTMINNMDLSQATATSELMVNTTSSGSHVYTCSVSVPVSPATDVIQGDDSTTITVQGERPPNAPTRLTASGVTHNSATIQWTVTSLAYGPEMYMVRYGTDMNNLGLTSDMVSSGGDIAQMNFDLSIQLTDLQLMTQYFYRVVATNAATADGGMTSSVMVGMFNTSALSPSPPTALQGTPSTDPAVAPSISFTWAVPNITNGEIQGYDVTCMSTGLNDSTVSSTTTSATVSDLENGVRYCCIVIARNEQSSSMPSEPFCTTTIEIAPTGPPRGFMEQVNDARNVTFRWTPPSLVDRNGNITSYNLTCVSTTVGREAFLTRVYPPDESNRYTLPGFRPNTMHSCSVFAINSAGRGPEASDSFTTLQDEPDGPPQDITVDLVAGEPTQLMFNFNPPQEDLQNGAIVAYRISCTYSGGSMPVVDMFLSSLSRPYTLSNLRPATQYSCTLAASTSVGFGVEDTVQVLTMPGSPAIVSITPGRSSLLVSWSYTNPSLAEGAVISGYRVYLNDSRNGQVTDSSTTQFNITSLSPFTYYTVQVSAYNMRGGGVVQEGPRSDAIMQRTDEDFPGSPICQNRWEPSSTLMSVTVSWGRVPPEMANGDITAYIIELTRYGGGATVSAGVQNDTSTTSLTLSGFLLPSGVPYTVRISAMNGAGNGPACTVTDFGDEDPAPAEIYNSINGTRSRDGTSLNITWTVLPLNMARGFVTFVITFETGSRKRQAGGGGGQCTPPSCRVAYEQGGVIATGLVPEERVVYTVQAVNGEMEPAIGEARRITAEPNVSPTTPTEDGGNTIIIIIVIIVVVLLLVASVVIIIVVVVVVKRRNSKATYSPRHTKAASMELEEKKNFFEDSGQLNRSPSPPQNEEQPPSPVASPEIHEADRLLPIEIEYFGEHVKSMHENRDKKFEREYESLPNDTTIPATAAANNKPKNRFANIHPYDFSRVKLSAIEGVEGSEYINASYIDGYNRANAYVAAQGPMPNTVGDFWRMVWEHRLSTIVMLTKVTEGGKRKCESYWPDNVHDVYNPPNTSLSVSFEELQPFADYEIKKLVVTNPSDPQSSPLTITHYHFLGWPDHGVPQFATSLIAFIRRVRSKYHKGAPPMLVHCSAGVGRTGTFIVLDTMLERMQHETSVNVYEFVRSMRAKRIHMVQTQAQYVFIHDALDELITCGDTSIASHDLRIKIGNLGKIVPGKIITGFQHQFELLDQVSRKITDKDCSDALQHYNSAKNRYPDRIPFNTNRVRLRPTGVTGAEYINASFVDGYKKRNAYIATQAPLENTVNDFWRMIWEFKSKCIVMLCDLNEHDKESSFGYWPTSEDTPTHYGKLIVTLKSEKQDKEFVIRKFEITEDKAQSAFGNDKVASFTVTQFQFAGWEEQGRPDAANGVLQMSESVNSVQRSTGNKPITVICNDGIGRTGAFICIHAQLERVKTEGVVDVFQFVKSSRISRPNFLSEQEYYIFSHHTMADFLDTFDTYANFKDLGAANL